MSDFLKKNKRTEPNKRTPFTFEEIKWLEKRTYVLRVVKIAYKRGGKNIGNWPNKRPKVNYGLKKINVQFLIRAVQPDFLFKKE